MIKDYDRLRLWQELAVSERTTRTHAGFGLFLHLTDGTHDLWCGMPVYEDPRKPDAETQSGARWPFSPDEGRGRIWLDPSCWPNAELAEFAAEVVLSAAVRAENKIEIVEVRRFQRGLRMMDGHDLEKLALKKKIFALSEDLRTTREALEEARRPEAIAAVWRRVMEAGVDERAAEIRAAWLQQVFESVPKMLAAQTEHAHAQAAVAEQLRAAEATRVAQVALEQRRKEQLAEAALSASRTLIERFSAPAPAPSPAAVAQPQFPTRPTPAPTPRSKVRVPMPPFEDLPPVTAGSYRGEQHGAAERDRSPYTDVGVHSPVIQAPPEPTAPPYPEENTYAAYKPTMSEAAAAVLKRLGLAVTRGAHEHVKKAGT